MHKIYQITLGMVSVFAIKGEKTILVDAGLPGTYDKIKAELEANGILPEDISLIVITHGHSDHVGELGKLRGLTKAKIVMHKKDADYLKRGESAPVCPTDMKSRIIKRLFVQDTRVAPIVPDIEVDNEFSLDCYGVKGKLIYTPGHTMGCISVLLSSGEAVIGDMIAGGGEKNRSKIALPIFMCDLDATKSSLKKIVEYSPSRIYNSHGQYCVSNDIKKLLEKL